MTLILAAINRNVTVRLLVSDRANSRPYMKRLLRSLAALDGLRQMVKIEIKLFSVSAQSHSTKNALDFPF